LFQLHFRTQNRFTLLLETLKRRSGAAGRAARRDSGCSQLMGDLKQQRFRIGPADKLHLDADVVSDRPNFALIGRVVKYALSLRVGGRLYIEYGNV